MTVSEEAKASNERHGWTQHMAGVHQAHCCRFHGCKYGYDDCRVALGELPQDYWCEACDDNKGWDELEGYAHHAVVLMAERERHAKFVAAARELADKTDFLVKVVASMIYDKDAPHSRTLYSAAEQTHTALASLRALLEREA